MLHFYVVFLLCRSFPLIFNAFPSVLVCNPDLFFSQLIYERCTTVAFIYVLNREFDLEFSHYEFYIRFSVPWDSALIISFYKCQLIDSWRNINAYKLANVCVLLLNIHLVFDEEKHCFDNFTCYVYFVHASL